MKEDIQKVDGTEEDAWDRVRWKHMTAVKQREQLKEEAERLQDEIRAGNRKEGKMEKVKTKQYRQKKCQSQTGSD